MIGAIVFSIGSGVMTWSFLEYLLHRWGGHDRRLRRTPHGAEHLQHHIQGDYFAPAWKKLVFAALLATIAGAITIPLAGELGVAYVGGLIGFYGFYEWLHRRDHTHAGIGGYGRWARKHHFRHHLVDARSNFGVTSPLWDHVFGTYRAPGVIKVPPRLCMSWLLDDNGQVDARYAGTFVMASKPSSNTPPPETSPA